LGLKQAKYDNTNLLRYIDNTCKDDENFSYIMNVCDRINSDVSDITDVVDWNVFPTDILISIQLWKPTIDRTCMSNYAKFKQLIEGSSLERDQIIAILKEPYGGEIADYNGAMEV